MDVLVELLDPLGNPLPVQSVTVTESVNLGWTWSATLSRVPHTYTVNGVPNKSLLDAFLEDATYTLTLEVDGVTKVLPPLVATDYQEDISGGGVLSGIDLIMYRLTRSTHVIPDTWRNTTTTAIINSMATEMGLSGYVSGHLAFEFAVLEEEAGGRTNFLTPLTRILDVACYEFRCIPAYDMGGVLRGGLEFYPLEIAPAGAAPAQPAWSRVTRQRTFSERITQLRFLKTSRMGLDANGYNFEAAAPGDVFALPSTLSAAQTSAVFSGQPSPSDLPDLYSGDPGAGGVLLGKGVAFELGDVTHVKATKAGPLTVMGTRKTLIPAGVELAFEVFHDTGISPPRPPDEPWSESLWPNRAYVNARTQTYMWARNRGTHTLSFEGPPALALGLGSRLTWPDHPESRAESITHTLGIGQASTSVEAAVLASSQW